METKVWRPSDGAASASRFRRARPLVLVRIIFPGDTPLLPSLFQPCFIPANRLVSSSFAYTLTGVNTAVGTISDRPLIHFNARLVPKAGPPAWEEPDPISIRLMGLPTIDRSVMRSSLWFCLSFADTKMSARFPRVGGDGPSTQPLENRPDAQFHPRVCRDQDARQRVNRQARGLRHHLGRGPATWTPKCRTRPQPRLSGASQEAHRGRTIAVAVGGA